MPSSPILWSLSIARITSIGVFSKFARSYGKFDKVIGFSRMNIEDVIDELNKCCLETLCDLHTSSYSDPEFIYWMKRIKVGKIRTPVSRANLIRCGAISIIEELEDRVIKTEIHNVDHYLQRLNLDLEIEEDSLRIEPTEEDKEYARLKKQGFNGKMVVGFIPNSMREHKKWDLKNWIYVSNQLDKDRFTTVVLCAGFEAEETKRLAEKTNSQILISNEPSNYVRDMLSTDLIISIDTGPKHIAGYLNHPVISLYGHASPKIWGTLSSSEIYLVSDIECSPCNNPFFCKYEKATCVDSISPDLVVERIKYLMEKE